MIHDINVLLHPLFAHGNGRGYWRAVGDAKRGQYLEPHQGAVWCLRLAGARWPAMPRIFLLLALTPCAATYRQATMNEGSMLARAGWGQRAQSSSALYRAQLRRYIRVRTVSCIASGLCRACFCVIAVATAMQCMRACYRGRQSSNLFLYDGEGRMWLQLPRAL